MIIDRLAPIRIAVAIAEYISKPWTVQETKVDAVSRTRAKVRPRQINIKRPACIPPFSQRILWLVNSFRFRAALVVTKLGLVRLKEIW